MTKLFVTALITLITAAALPVLAKTKSKTKTLCGEKSGGLLVDRNGKPVVTFTEQTFTQANDQVKGGMQEGVQYCAVMRLGADGKFEKLLKINRRHK